MTQRAKLPLLPARGGEDDDETLSGELIERNMTNAPLVFSRANPVGEQWRIDSEI
jgi:hypothetical protein